LTDTVPPLENVVVRWCGAFRRASIGALSLLWIGGAFGCRQESSTSAAQSELSSPGQSKDPEGDVTKLAPAPSGPEALEALNARLAQLIVHAGGKVGICIVHVESGRRVTVGGQQWLPLQSVFKLPLAVAVLRDVRGGQVSLDQMLTVRAEDRAPGVASNAKKWEQVPREVRVRQLLEYSLVDSDNTSSDKLLDLLGGPKALTERMQSLGFSGILVRSPTKAMGSAGELPNEGTPEALASLLASLQRGEVLEGPQRALLWDVMGRARTGERRIRAGLPPGTQVVDKTGTGGNGSATNDVGVVTLPGSAGHLAIAVLIAASSLPARAQEDLIAQIARTAFDSFIGSSRGAPSPP
jgi:beta-lactamase class A